MWVISRKFCMQYKECFFEIVKKNSSALSCWLLGLLKSECKLNKMWSDLVGIKN